MQDALTLAGQRAVTEAERLFLLDVYDPSRADHTPRGEHSRMVISNILTASGWTWLVPYAGNGAVEWCGLFAGACWRAAGLDPKWLATYWASTLRLTMWARYRSWNAKHPNPEPTDARDRRLLAELDARSTSLPFDPRPGDVLVVGDGSPVDGDHITIVTGYDSGTFETISGNGGGLGPDGRRREGIVRRDFRLGGAGYCARRLIRPAFGDLMAERG